jgi:hypothetical protein
MMHAQADTFDARIARAVAELQNRIKHEHPAATFDVAHGEDPDGTYIWTAVDMDDPDAVLDSVVDRLLELQIDEGFLFTSSLSGRRSAFRPASPASSSARNADRQSSGGGG